MHKQNLPLPLRACRPASSSSPDCTQTWTCTQSGVDIGAQSTNTHADINAARYTLLHSSSAETSLFSEHPVLHSSPCAFHHLLGHPAPPAKRKLTFWGQPSKLTLPKMWLPPPLRKATHPPTPPTPLTRPGKHAGQTCSECAPVMG